MIDLDALIRLLVGHDMSWHNVVEVLARHEAAQHISYDALCDKARTAAEQYETAVRELENECLAG